MEKETKKIGEELVKAVETMKKNGQNAEKQQGKNAQTAKVLVCKVPSLEADKKALEADTLQREIERKTRELQKCLEELERKKQLSNNRTAFIQALDNLEAAANRLSENNGFETTLYKLRFTDISTSYSGNEIFSISNTFIIKDFVEFMKERIKGKIEDIEAQLIA